MTLLTRIISQIFKIWLHLFLYTPYKHINTLGEQNVEFLHIHPTGA